MPIYYRGYRPWQGEISSLGLRWWAIAARAFWAQVQNRWVATLLVMSLVPGIMLGGFFAIWGLLEQGAPALDWVRWLIEDLPPAMQREPREYRDAVWTLALDIYFVVATFPTYLLMLLVGPDLISQDLRANALPLYWSRPIQRSDYFLGKWSVPLAFVFGMLAIPLCLAYVIGFAFSLDPQLLWETTPLLGKGLLYAALVGLSLSLLILALSSLNQRTRNVVIFWVAIWIGGGTLGGWLSHAYRTETLQVLSYTHTLGRLRVELLQTHAAWENVKTLLPDRPGSRHGPQQRWMLPPGIAPSPTVYPVSTVIFMALASVIILHGRVRSLDRSR